MHSQPLGICGRGNESAITMEQICFAQLSRYGLQVLHVPLTVLSVASLLLQVSHNIVISSCT